MRAQQFTGNFVGLVFVADMAAAAGGTMPTPEGVTSRHHVAPTRLLTFDARRWSVTISGHASWPEPCRRALITRCKRVIRIHLLHSQQLNSPVFLTALQSVLCDLGMHCHHI